MKKRILLSILCIAAVSILPACNKQNEGPESFECEVAYKDTLENFREVLSPGDTELLSDGMYGVYEAAQSLGDAAAETIG